MNKPIAVLALAAALATSATVHAEPAATSVVFTLGADCPHARNWRTLGRELIQNFQNPDGTSSRATVPYQVPGGSLLELTDLEYHPNENTSLFKMNSTVNISVQNRADLTVYYNAASFRVGVGAMGVFGPVDLENLNYTGQFLSDIQTTRTFTFGAGPRISAAGRVCVDSLGGHQSPQFEGSVILRGRVLVGADTSYIPPRVLNNTIKF